MAKSTKHLQFQETLQRLYNTAADQASRYVFQHTLWHIHYSLLREFIDKARGEALIRNVLFFYAALLVDVVFIRWEIDYLISGIFFPEHFIDHRDDKLTTDWQFLPHTPSTVIFPPHIFRLVHLRAVPILSYVIPSLTCSPLILFLRKSFSPLDPNRQCGHSQKNCFPPLFCPHFWHIYPIWFF